MSFPQNIFSALMNVGGQSIGEGKFYEIRTENDGDGDPIYIGWSPIANASTSDNVWFIQKIHYDGTDSVERVQMPLNGNGFKYAWDLRNTYF